MNAINVLVLAVTANEKNRQTDRQTTDRAAGENRRKRGKPASTAVASWLIG